MILEFYATFAFSVVGISPGQHLCFFSAFTSTIFEHF